MPEQDVKAGELNKAEEVLDVVLPSGDKAAEVVHPSEEPLRVFHPLLHAGLSRRTEIDSITMPAPRLE